MSETATEPPLRVRPASDVGAGVRAARRMETGGILFRRWAGCWIDFIAAAICFFIPALLFAAISPGMTTASLALTLVCLAAPLAYYIVTEALWGRTLGKLITGTVVVDAAGRKPGFGRATVRTLARLLEVNPFLLGGLPAGLVAAFTQHHQRVGDLMAKTYVVPVKLLGEIQAGSAKGELEVFD
jgi:uncharacterized RDD family membrane protein YckC